MKLPNREDIRVISLDGDHYYGIPGDDGVFRSVGPFKSKEYVCEAIIGKLRDLTMGAGCSITIRDTDPEEKELLLNAFQEAEMAESVAMDCLIKAVFEGKIW